MAIDIALINANIKTMNSTNSVAEALAITKNKIVKVGSNHEITALIDKDTKVIDLKRKTVLPGLIDTHIHVADYGQCLMWLDLTEAKSIAEIQKIIEDKALFSSDMRLINSYLDEAPFTAPVSQDSPGRVGTWIGWQIVNSYMKKNNNVSLRQLANENNYQLLLQKSDYRP